MYDSIYCHVGIIVEMKLTTLVIYLFIYTELFCAKKENFLRL